MLYPRVRVLENTVTGQGGYDHHSNARQENVDTAGGGRYPTRLPDNQVPVIQPPRREREHNWKMTGVTECSASCGKGRETQFVLHVNVSGFYLQTSREAYNLSQIICVWVSSYIKQL